MGLSEIQNNGKLIMNGVEIHSLKELRDNFNKEELLNFLMEKKLYNWLKERYYETEAEKIQLLSIETPNCLKNLCEALGIKIKDEKRLSEAEIEKLNEKREILKKYTDDASVIENAMLVAMNQEELAKLLNSDEKVIYLCDNDFTIPISKSQVKYIGVANVNIENPFTKEQYEKAGITMENIALPTDEDPERSHIAEQAAVDNGYDFYGEKHNYIASRMHKSLKTSDYVRFYNLDYNRDVIGNYYTSRTECDNARKKCVQKAYEQAKKYVTAGNSKSFAVEAAKYYSEHIIYYFTPIMKDLETLSKILNVEKNFNQLDSLVNASEKNLEKIFNEELNSNSDFYKLYDYSYFLDMVEVEEHDNRVEEEGLFHILETFLPGSFEYTVENLIDTMSELQDDINDRAGTFFKSVHSLYKDYVGKIEKLLEDYGDNLPKAEQNEGLNAYIRRLCVLKVC